MKGTLDIEFILAIIVFLSTISFVTFVILSNIPVFHGESISEDLRARAYEISQLIIFDQGYPSDWNPSNVLRIGLSNGTGYVIDTIKVENLKSLCASDYARTKSLLGQEFRRDIKINIVDGMNTTILDCKPPVTSLVRQEFQISRFVTLNDTRIVRLAVSVL